MPETVSGLDSAGPSVPDDLRERREWAAEVVEACRGLDPLEHRVLMLAYATKPSLAEIAAQLNLPTCAVRTALGRGMGQLATLLVGPASPG